jgi:diacylglycerol kinase
MKIIDFLVSRIKSFFPAIEGLAYAIKHERNTWIHIVATIIALVAIVFLKLTYIESLLVLSAIFIVWICELLNTAIEYTLDFIQIEKNPKIKIIKDISAASVFLSALYALITAFIILLEKFSQ